MSTEKRLQYAALVAPRKKCARCVGFVNPAHYLGGVHDSEEIGPWTDWQGFLDAELMLVGQDWADVVFFEKHSGGDTPRNPTNRRLRELLLEDGFGIEDVGQRTGRGTIFLTNAVLCLMTGGLGDPVQTAWCKECGSPFLRPQVELVRPRALVTWETARSAPCAGLSAAVRARSVPPSRPRRQRYCRACGFSRCITVVRGSSRAPVGSTVSARTGAASVRHWTGRPVIHPRDP